MNNQLLKNAFVAYSRFYCALFDEIVKLSPRMQGRLGGFEIEPRMATNYKIVGRIPTDLSVG